MQSSHPIVLKMGEEFDMIVYVSSTVLLVVLVVVLVVVFVGKRFLFGE